MRRPFGQEGSGAGRQWAGAVAGANAVPSRETGSGQSNRPDPVRSDALQKRFMSQLVGVLETKFGNSRTGTSVIPVFSGLYGNLAEAFSQRVM